MTVNLPPLPGGALLCIVIYFFLLINFQDSLCEIYESQLKHTEVKKFKKIKGSSNDLNEIKLKK